MKYQEAQIYAKNKHLNKGSVYTKTKIFALILLFVILISIFLSLTFRSRRVILASQYLYGITVGSYATESSANYYANLCRARGGAGGVYFDGKNYLLFVAVYSSKSDANIVTNNLLQKGESAYIFEWELKQTKICFESGNKILLEEICAVFWDSLSKILTLALEYDRDSMSISDVNEEITELLEKTDDAILTAEKLKGDSTQDSFQEILGFLALQKTVLTQIQKSVVSSVELKIAYFDLLLLNVSLREKF